MWIPVNGDMEQSNYVSAAMNGYDYRTTVDHARNFGSPEAAREYARVHNSVEDPSELIYVQVGAIYTPNYIPNDIPVAGKPKPRGRAQGTLRNEPASHSERRRRSDHDN